MLLGAIILWGASFFLGAVPFGLVIANYYRGPDLRASGSGNIGATNVARTMGIKFGLFTLLLDVTKGLVPVLVAGALFKSASLAGGYEWLGGGVIPAGAGLAAFLGHIYSPFLGFKGGKGVATALGVCLGVIPLAILPALVVFVLVVAVWGYISAGSMSSALVLALSAYLMSYPPPACILALVMAVFIFLRHRENLIRLIRGEENKWRKADSGDSDKSVS